MRKVYLLIVGALILTACFPIRFTTTTYDVGLKNVEVPTNAKQQFSESMVKTSSEDGVNKYTFEDEMIAITWYASSSQFNFTLRNKTNHSIKIPWDEVAYINPAGESMRCIHSGIKLIDRNNSQAPTIVAKNSILTDILIPANHIYYISGQYGGWQEKKLFGEYETQEAAKQSGMIGVKVSILLPIIIENITNEYTFQFELKDIIVGKHEIK